MPPDAARVAEYAEPTCPFGSETVVMVKVAGLVVSVRTAVVFCVGLPASVTLKVRDAPETAAVGVPVMAPVDVFSDSPAGNVPLVSDQV